MYKLILLLILNVIQITFQESFSRLRDEHLSKHLTTSHIAYLANMENSSNMNEILDNILIPRVVGTPNHHKVFNYIKSQLEDLDWDVEVDEFQQKAPIFGQLTFRNIIGSLNPHAQRYLVLACHYDSKYFENDNFLGATDSAVPCAMMLNLAKLMRKELANIKNNTNLSLKLMFLDGEEAFVNWGPNDSIYGAKHLAKRMSQTFRRSFDDEEITAIDQIDVFILLDLLGAPNPTFYNFFKNTSKWFSKFHMIEERLYSKNLLSSSYNNAYFMKKSLSGTHIEDDHIPFLRKGVPILHLIPIPFPKEWHTSKDNRDLIDMDTVEDLNKILRVFVAEYLHIPISDDDLGPYEENHEEL